MTESDSLVERLRQTYLDRRIGPYIAWNPVNRAQVWQWCSAMGDRNPLYLDGEEVVAPPMMMQMWIMRDVHGNYRSGSTDENAYQVLKEFDAAGYSATVAVNYDQTYHQYLSEGDLVHSYTTIADISEKKVTGLGEGYFVTEASQYFRQNDELFGEARVTYFKYKPPEKAPGAAEPGVRKIERIRPVENHDSKHFWQGLRDGKFLIQVCEDCDTPRHPPQPMCEACQSTNWRAIESTGRGTIFSYTTIHYPEIPPFDYPNSIVLVDLDEGVRIAAQLRGTAPESIEIGAKVQAHIEEVQEGLSLPIFEVIDA